MDMSSPPDWHTLGASEVCEILKTSSDAGLDAAEAERRMEAYGPNVLTRRKGKSALVRFLLQLRQPLVLLLVAAGIVTFAIGETVDAAVILGIVMINAAVGYLQESKAIGALEALAGSMTTEALVLRSGRTFHLPAERLVPGDVALLRSGDKVPADLRLLSIRGLRVDESALTGESAPVEKRLDAVAADAVLADRTDMAYASTLVVFGQGAGVVVASGDVTEIGRIATMTAEADELATPLTREIARFSRVLMLAIVFLSVLTFAVGTLRGETASDMFMAAVALAVGAIPEGLPAAVTVILAIGVSRMAARGAIIRKLPAVETLGGASVICSDKTGTLTQNRMTVRRIYAAGASRDVTGSGYEAAGGIEGGPGSDAALRMTLLTGLLCNDSRIEGLGTEARVVGDPTEAALITAARAAGLDPAEAARQTPLLDTQPFDSELQFMATLHDQGHGGPRLILVKGSAEVVLDRSEAAMAADGRRGPLDRAAVEAEIGRMGGLGLRILAMAVKEVPADVSGLTPGLLAGGFVFTGLEGMLDPPRPEAVAAVAAFHRAGVEVKMITGDHAATATAIARQLGLDRPDGALTGAAIARLSDADLARAVGEVAVFARVAPDQKLRLVKALQSRGKVVAMTGDGGNDAPALKQADIGVAMGLGGTEAAKEAADMILTDDNFATIEAAAEEGRGVYDNLIKFIVWTLPTNLGEGLVILAAVLFGLPLPILPVQILWINMTTAGCLGLMLAFEPKESGIMDRPPRDPDHPILDMAMVGRLVMVGALLLAASFGLYEWELTLGADRAVARTVAVNTFVCIEAVYLFNCRSLSQSIFRQGLFGNGWIVSGALLMLALQLGFTYAPLMHRLFGAAPIGMASWLRIGVAALAAFFLVELEKAVRRRRDRGAGKGDKARGRT